MDPTSIPPPPTNTVPMPTITADAVPSTVPFPDVAPAEANNHVAPAANASPSAATAPNHPPYAEMIFSAITSLKEKNGSSKRAIAKYIEQSYPHLPLTHSALLTHHLKRLKSSGNLVMVKKSYKLPRSDASTSIAQRSRGRPPKLKPQPQPQPQPQLQSSPQQPQPVPLANVQQNAEPVWVALGLEDEPASEVKKRGPGRPRKTGGEVVGQPGPPLRRGRPPGSTTGPGRSRLPKRPGRPPKPKSVSSISNGLKRRPGRPPKIQSNVTVIPFAAPVPSVPANTVPTGTAPAVPPTAPTATVPFVSPRPRGRPKKNEAAVPVSGAAPQAVIGASRGRGRGMRQGRPPKVAGVGRPKNPTGRPVGRPKKGTSATTSQKVANEDLRRKLEYFQSKVKESLGVIKPHFNHESPVTAIAAIQDLEILATMDLNAPLRDETHQLPQLPQQQLVPQPQHLPQPQMYQQHLPQLQPQHLYQTQQLFPPHAPGPS